MNKERESYILMVITALFWAGAFVAGKYAVLEFPPFTLTFLRFLFATIFIFPIMIKYEKKDWKIKINDIPILSVLGLTGMFGYHVLFFIALTYTTAIKSSIIIASNPLFTSIFAAIIVNEKLGIKRIGAILLAFSGVLLAVSNGDINTFTNMTFNIGDVILIGPVIFYAFYSALSKKVMDRFSPLIITSYSFLICLIVLIPFVIIENPLEAIKNSTYVGWISIIYMGIFASGIGYLLHQYSNRNIGPSKTMAFVNLVPIFSMVLSHFILGEEITEIVIISAAIIITGVFINSRIKNKVVIE